MFTWGFGGYGRLGHAEPKDEWVPRLLKGFDGPNRGCTMIASGSAYAMAVNECGEYIGYLLCGRGLLSRSAYAMTANECGEYRLSEGGYFLDQPML